MGDCYLSAAGAMSKSFPPCHAVLRKDDTFCNYIAQTSVYLYLLIIEYIYIYVYITVYGHRHNYRKNMFIVE